MAVDSSAIQKAREQLNQHLREIIQWHFSPETGCPFWLDWARKNFDPRPVVQTVDDVMKFPHFQDEWLRDLQPEVWVPAAFQGKPFNIFETGGTTGMPKQRIGWNDYKVDYEEFSGKVSDAHFPRGEAWLMVGPTGPRRLRLAIEHLANFRGSPCYFIDLDPRFVKKVLADKKFEVARSYMDHVVDQGVTILKHRKVAGLFTTPKLLEAMAEKVNLYESGIRGVFCGGTTMAPQYVRYIVEEVLEGKIGFYPTYGNTLMGLAASVPLRPEDKFSITSCAAATSHFESGGSGEHVPNARLRRMGTRGTDHVDARVFHAALPGARRSHSARTTRALRLGRGGRGASLRRDGEADR